MSDPTIAIICRYSIDGTVRFANEAFGRFVGVPHQELVGLELQTLAGCDGFPLSAHGVAVPSPESPAVTSSHLQKSRDGTTCQVNFVHCGTFDASGDLAEIQAIGQPVAERVQVDEQSREIYDRLTRIARSVPGVIYQYKLLPDGRSCFPYASEAIREIYRVAPEDVREDASAVFAVLHPDDYDGIVASIMRSATTLEPWQYEYRVRFPDGTEQWLFGNALPSKQDDGAVLWHGFITDITDRKRVEQALVRREEQLKEAQSLAHLGNWERSFTTGELVWSDEMFHIYGADCTTTQTPESCLANVHPHDRMLTEQSFMRSLEDRSPLNLTHRVVTGDKGLKYVHVRGEHFYAADGMPLRSSGTAQDVTDRVLREAALVSNERRLQSIIGSMAEGLVLQDRAGQIIDANGAAGRILGLTRDQLLGRTSMDPERQAVREDGTPFPAHDHPSMVTLRTGKPLRDQIMGIRDPALGRRWISINSMPIFGNETTEPDSVVTTFVDISERREVERKVAESEHRLRTVIANVPAMISYWSQDARCIFGNQAYAEWFGVAPEKLPGLTPVEVIGPEHHARTAPHLKAVLRGEARNFEREFLDPRGRLRRIQVSFMPYVLNGAQRGFFVFGTDVTELNRRVEERTQELAIAKCAAETASRAKDELVSNVSHEMRTPLHAIMSFANLGRTRLRPDNTETCRDYFEKIHRSGARLARFVNNLLDLARMGSGEVQANRVPTDLAGLIRNVVNELAVLTDEREQSVSIRVAAANPTIDVDPVLMERVLINLLSNASKFSPVGGSISVTVADEAPDPALPDAGPLMRITVTDDGPGIPDPELESIFDPFVQSTRTKKGTGGTGLGLPIVKKIIALHGGSVWARNPACGGAAFEVVLPCHVPAGEQPAVTAA